jgi:hypothetical protein
VLAAGEFSILAAVEAIASGGISFSSGEASDQSGGQRSFSQYGMMILKFSYRFSSPPSCE